ncbi:MAG: hypothetical protein EOM55_00400 [Clostridia bacterium]|nr:hypothetical protein [Clostridia bacterium]
MKTMILNNEFKDNQKAVLSLKENEKSIIKFFNLNNKGKNLALGIKQDKTIVKIPLFVNDGKSEFQLNENIDFSKNLLCAVVDVSNTFCPEILLSGSNNSSDENEKIEDAFALKKPQDSSTLYVQETEEKIENIIDSNLAEDMKENYFDECAKCKYREAFYSGCDSLKDNSEILTKKDNFNEIKQIYAKKQNDDDIKEKEKDFENEELDKKKDEDEEKDFYSQVKDQVETLFEKYKPDEDLKEIIPNSKWVRVTYDGEENFYVLGLISDEENVLKYISYGVPSSDSTTPPDDLIDYAQWLPKDMNSIHKEGYWIVCQDAKTGETLKIQLV